MVVQGSSPATALLSRRGQDWADLSRGLPIWKIVKDLWDPESNRNGYVSLGVADNALMHKDLASYIQQKFSFHRQGLTYGDGGSGSRRLRAAFAQLLTRKLSPVSPLTPNDVTITNGVTSSIEHVTSIFADPGDVFLVGRPYYRSFIEDIGLRTGVKVVTVSFGEVDPFSIDAVAVYESEVKRCEANGQRVAGLMLCNPHNPLGRCYTRDCLVELVELCEKHRIHLISDEIYALSVFSGSFTSILSIDSSMVHVIYGLSKDFGANGIRIGCIVSQNNPDVHQALVPVTKYSYASSLAESMATTLLEDDVYVDWFVKENCQRLRKNFEFISAWAVRHNLEFESRANAGFFVWVNLGKVFLHKVPEVEEKDVDVTLNQELLDRKVFLAAGSAFGSEKVGWFRLTFSQDEIIFKEGLKRIESVLGLE